MIGDKQNDEPASLAGIAALRKRCGSQSIELRRDHDMTRIAPLLIPLAMAQPALAQRSNPQTEPPRGQAQPNLQNSTSAWRTAGTMKQMQAQMDKVRQTQDPQERQRLLQEHWNSMQAAMAAMHGVWGPGGPACCGAESQGVGPEHIDGESPR
ncbi:MAG: hypothetical protein IPG91_10250 [Ideonella sp.]|nr:hypothetical protein [Ideonella sp.]